ncbi:spindle assembly checkpoint kinase [Yamadazyma tenuis]|uniref:Aurora kinase n=1 Tax=Candida tenuis (strain ATCC 10573 / BCRC 21748 / CBS 615 / JCM 9827 / NBRC 10315 / NRRL Y-1498 / VKM Y-70) TaxID=590646 RepID=G3BAF8_CANTC|nr:uncharacterized protein CANTEDRAFT_125535 [Yamadazyma tenuis ATCC 10573]XP_006688219.1 kinase-like protein [Yamadazyma tenuis ATCC 10573]EGV62048.1 hypothetical protein CANTEDRAFT_125535 [Yamadazyma tenuis ATCC 10573]EGV62049.1 kinase-like protein [Yamadazyma tenuis ATCC 10573]WEJ93297.1 spindle assembly checkpoint kinase [Yamadazyma tenuis]
MIRKSLRPLKDTTNVHKDTPVALKPVILKNAVADSLQFLHNSNLTKLKVKPSVSLSHFEIGKTLGKGKLGSVYCVKHKASNFVCALKVMNLETLRSLKLQKNLQREIEIQSSLQHPNILKLFSYFYDSKNVYLVIEYSINGELYHHLRINKRFTNTLASFYIYQVTLGLIYLHSNGIIHRDLKPENILVDFNHTVKLSDFGWSVKIERNAKRSTICGTLDYLSPEMVNSMAYDFKSDIWSLGVLIYELLVGKPPFEHHDRNVTYKRIVGLDLKFPPFVNDEAKELILSLLKTNPSDRLPLEQVLTHPWLMKNKQKWPGN